MARNKHAVEQKLRISQLVEEAQDTLKLEMYYLCEFQSFEELRKAIKVYIHFYNHHRYQNRLNGLRSVEQRSRAALLSFYYFFCLLNREQSIFLIELK